MATAAIAMAATAGFSVPAGETGGAKALCAQGKLATGGGYRSADDTAWSQRAATPAGRGFRVRLVNDAASENSGEAVGVCANRDPFRVARKRVAEELTPADRAVTKTVRAGCPRGTKLAGGGYSLSSPGGTKPYVSQSRPDGRKWLAKATLTGTGDHVLKVRAICDTRAGADYVVRDKALSDLRRRAAPRGLTGLLQIELDVPCKGPSRASAGGFSATGDYSPRWSTFAPNGGDYEFVGRDGLAKDPAGDVVGFALCRK